LERNVQLRRELLADVEAVAPTLTEHAADSEVLARLNTPSIEAVRKTRLLRFICPKERGGDEADPVTQLEIIEALAKIDGPPLRAKRFSPTAFLRWLASRHHAAARSPSTAATVSTALGLSGAASIMRIGF
jgi:alkylation response protein AidB-like acyl-CoA dehydrogenase